MRGARGELASDCELAMSTSSFANVLEAISRQRGVRASLIVSESDGLIVDAALRFGQDGDRLAALAASLYRKARLSAGAAWLGGVAFLQLDADRGRICVAGGRGDLIIVVVAEPAANVGLIRVELLKAVESLE
jgi:predicted regulator of Ras-like GTPase activity (Roadblock/LC7/MglB family)